jgi:hypothetical protein
VTSPERHQSTVTSGVSGHRQMLQDGARRTDRRRGVGVDADDDTKIWMESQHAVRSFR